MRIPYKGWKLLFQEEDKKTQADHDWEAYMELLKKEQDEKEGENNG